MKANGIKTMPTSGSPTPTATAGCGDAALGADRRHQDRGRGEVQPQRPVGHRPDPEDRRGQSGSRADRRGRHARATPQKELVARNYKGKIYQTHGIANPDSCASWARTATHDPADRSDARVRAAARFQPAEEGAAEYITKYEAKYGKDSRSTFGGHAWDSYLLLARAVPRR